MSLKNRWLPRVKQGVLPLAQHLQQLVTFVKKGGKLSAWTIVGSATGFSVGLIAIPQHLTVSGFIGAMFGSGLYASRIFQIHKDSDMGDLADKLTGLLRSYDLGLMTKAEYDRLRKKILDKAKF